MAAVALPGGYRLVSLEAVDSTNDEAKRLAAAGAADGTVVWAREQTAGKGRRGRTWISEPGNLYCSLLLRPDFPAGPAAQLGFVAANAVLRTVAAELPRGVRVSCKWPNDVMVGGRKTAGILLEAGAATAERLDWLVVGVGVNIASHPPMVEFPATSLHAEGAEGVSEKDVLTTFCQCFDEGLRTWREAGFAATRQAWLERAEGLGEPVTVRLERETLDGIFHDLDEAGALVLRRNGEERRITAGDVFPAEP